MLHYVAECVTPEMLESTIAKFGDGGCRLVGKFRVVGDWPRSPRYGDGQDVTDGCHVNSSVDESTEHHDALLYLLKRASTDEHFEMLVRGAFDVVPDTYLAWDPSTKRAALSYITAASAACTSMVCHETPWMECHESRRITQRSNRPIYALIHWVHAEMISRSQLPASTFTLIIKDYAADAWDTVKQTVILQAVMGASYQRLHLDPPQRLNHIDFLGHPYALPCHYPNTFTVAMKEFLERKSTFITFDGVQEPVWNYEALLEAHLGWSPEMCYAEWKSLSGRWVKLPTGGKRALAKPYKI
jgi:hypothetical protein